MTDISLVFFTLSALAILLHIGVFSKTILIGLLPILTLIFCIAPNILVSFFGQYALNKSNGKVEAVSSHLIQTIISLLVNVGYFGMIVFILVRILAGNRIQMNKILIIFTIIWSYVSVIDLLRGSIHVANLGVLLVVGTLMVMPKLLVQTFVKQTVLVVQAVVISSAMMGLAFPEKAWIQCRIDKCTFENLLFRGIFPYSNQLGLMVGLLAPIGLVIFQNRIFLVLYTFETIFFVYITGSRIALAAISFGYLAYFLQNHINKRIVFLLSFLTTFAGLLPFESNTTLTGRTFLWEIAKAKIRESPLGSGSYAWQSSGSSLYLGAASSYSSHNLILEMLLTGGIPILMFYLLLMREIYLIIAIYNSKALFPFMIAFSVVAIGERPFSLYFIDFSIPIFLSFILMNASKRLQISFGNETSE